MTKNIKTNIEVNGQSYDIQAQDTRELTRELIKAVYQTEFAICGTKSGAVLNTSVILNVGEATIWRVINAGSSTR
jgi:hypothetical protein